MSAKWRSVCEPLCVVTCLLLGAQGCVNDDLASTRFAGSDGSVPAYQDKVSEAELSDASTEELVRRMAALPDETVVVFDFDDTLRDHRDWRSSVWASYAGRAVEYLKKHDINISVCSQNQNKNGALNRKLPDLDSEVFNDAFFRSDAFQDDTGREKWDNIQKIMRHFGVTREDHVLFFDDNPSHIRKVGEASDAVAYMVEDDGLDRPDFRGGLVELLLGADNGGGGGGGNNSGGGGSCGDDVPSKDYCSVCGNCQDGEGDCDDDSECAPGLVCVSAKDGGDKSQPGYDICVDPSGGAGSCKGECSPECPCQEGEGDCDVDADCAGDLVCPPDGEGSERCEQPTEPPGGGGGTNSGGGNTCGDDVPSKDYCSVCGNCQAGEGDCDADSECAPGLVWVSAKDGGDKSQPGYDICAVPGGDTGGGDTGGGDTGGNTGGGEPGDGGDCRGECSPECPCQEGEGDCDVDADCAGDLVCPPDGEGAEECEQPSGDGGGGSTGSGNLRVRVSGRWVSVGCDGDQPRANGSSDRWRLEDRKLKNQDGDYLFCDEGWADGRDCRCTSGSSEAYHAITQADWDVDAADRVHGNALTDRLTPKGPMYIFPNNAHEFCLSAGSGGIIENVDGGDDGRHHESTHAGKCDQWCMGDGCP